jgi:hypothetical protein
MSARSLVMDIHSAIPPTESYVPDTSYYFNYGSPKINELHNKLLGFLMVILGLFN